jgi:hypothetical protein
MSGVTILPFEIDETKLHVAVRRVLAEELTEAHNAFRNAAMRFYQWSHNGSTNADVTYTDIGEQLADLHAARARYALAYERVRDALVELGMLPRESGAP